MSDHRYDTDDDFDRVLPEYDVPTYNPGPAQPYEPEPEPELDPESTPEPRPSRPSRIPPNAPRPQDRQQRQPTRAEREAADAARRRELEDEPDHVFTFRGFTFRFPKDEGLWPMEAIQAFSNDRHIDGVEHLLGPRQWARIKTMRLTLNDFGELSDVISAQAGFTSRGN